MPRNSVPWAERRDTATTIIVIILTVYFGVTALAYFAAGLFTIGHVSVGRGILICAVQWASAAILMYTARSFWKRNPGAIRWGFVSLAIVCAIWMKWPQFSEIYTTVVAAACLIWFVY